LVVVVGPWRTALRLNCCFPLLVFAPVLLIALRRFAEACFSEAIVWLAHQLASFGNLLGA
jgi:hypothetical protein